MRMAHRRRGNITVLSAVMIVVLVAITAFAIDCGYMTLARTNLQAAADAGAMAGAGALPKGEQAGIDTARDYVTRNVGQEFADTTSSVVIGHWDWSANQFVPDGQPRNAVEVTAHDPHTPLFFAKVLGHDEFESGAKAIATFRPRDIMLVLDYSGSMNEQSKIWQLKGAVALFCHVMKQSGSQDRIGFVSYATDARLERGLTYDYDGVRSAVIAKHADGWTNIGDAMYQARQQFTTRGRDSAKKMMVLMTDGLVNRPHNRDFKQYVYDEAQLATAQGIELVTISFGSDADTVLMERVADTGNGSHFVARGSVEEQAIELGRAFYDIATHRATVLVD
jgi:uncharacterized protein YegL